MDIRRNHRQSAALGLVFVAGVGLGFFLAWASFRTVILVDYDSGAMKRVVKLGPLTVSEDETLEEFGLLPIGNQKTGLTGAGNWHTAFVFARNSKKSANFEGGNVVNLIRRLQIAMHINPESNAPSVKEKFLTTLTTHGVSAAAEMVRDTELSMKDKSN